MRAGKKDWFLYISDELVKANLSVAEAIDVVKGAYRAHARGEAWLSDAAAQFLRDEPRQLSSYKVKGASLASSGVSGFRLIGNARSSERDPEQWTYRYCYLADSATAKPLALIDEYYQSALRTGVTGAVALSLLGRKDARVVGLIGAGTIARCLLEALTHFFTLSEIRVHSRSKASREAFAQEIEGRLPAEVETVASCESAARGADLVVTITDADQALVRQGWLGEGSTLCSMGNNQELDSKVLYEVDKFFVDELSFCKMVGDIHAWISKGDVAESEIAARLNGTIGEVMVGDKPGRESAREKILVVVQGMACCDLALARHVYDKLKNSEGIQRIAM